MFASTRYFVVFSLINIFLVTYGDIFLFFNWKINFFEIHLVDTLNVFSVKWNFQIEFLRINRSIHQRCSIIKGILRNFAKFAGKQLCQSPFWLATLLKKSLWHRCFPENFAKFLRTPFSQNSSWWLFPTNLVEWYSNLQNRSLTWLSHSRYHWWIAMGNQLSQICLWYNWSNLYCIKKTKIAWPSQAL